MKIYKNIFNDIVSLESIFSAWDAFKKGKRKKLDVQIFEQCAEGNLFRLHADLTSHSYVHAPYHAFFIRDPKVREIHKAIVRDRIVHHVVYQKLNPIFEKTFIADSYSSRKMKGTHKGVTRLETFTRKVSQTNGRCVVLKCDIRKFFASIDHEILYSILEKRIKDVHVLRLLHAIIESFPSTVALRERERERERESKSPPRKGCPIGNLTSQLFANIYMNEFDQFMKHTLKVKLYIRYTDDFVIVHHDEEYLLQILTCIEKFLRERLNLELHPHKIGVHKLRQGVDFLGYVQLPHTRVLRTKTKRRIFRKLEMLVSEERLFASFNSYMGVLAHANSYQLQEDLKHMLWHLLNSPDE